MTTLSACDGCGGEDTPGTDASSVDAHTVDSATSDALVLDAASVDRAAVDSAAGDAVALDRSSTDHAEVDSTPGDAGSADGASSDAVPIDTGGGDATVADVLSADRPIAEDAAGEDVEAPDSRVEDAMSSDATGEDLVVVDQDEDGVPAGVDCDDLDNQVGGPATWFLDHDGDLYGGNTMVLACAKPAGHVATEGDCDDEAFAVHPGAAEVWYDGQDRDCQGGSDWDQDGDGFDCDGSLDSACSGHVGTDCVDAPTGSGGTAGNAIHPDASEVWYDGLDQDCSGGSDHDQDGDGYTLVGAPDGSGDDCDDTNAQVNAAAAVAVPADFGSVQDAIDAACPNGLVTVAAGSYNERVDLGGKNLTLQGVARDSVFLDGTGLSGSVVHVATGSLRTLTIRNGSAVNGGGLLITGHDVEVDDVVVRDCGASTDGGGVMVQGAQDVRLNGLQVVHNTADGRGGGLMLDSADRVVVQDLIADSNVATGATVWPAGLGGGIFTWGGNVQVDRPVFLDNQAVYGAAADGHAAYSDVWLERNSADNYCFRTTEALTGLYASGNTVQGGAECVVLVVGSGMPPADFSDIIVVDNDAGRAVRLDGNGITLRRAEVVGAGHLVGIYTGASSGTLEHVTVAGASSMGIQFSLWHATTAMLHIVNSTIVDCGEGISGQQQVPRVTLRNTILAGNTLGLRTWGQTLDVSFCDFFGNTSDVDGMVSPVGSAGNVAVEPGFVSWAPALPAASWDLHLAPGSALIDAGDPAIQDPGGDRSDLGAYGGPAAATDYYADTDGDGMYEGWETRFGLDPASDDSAGDLDVDGLTNGQEFARGTDPRDADSDDDGATDGAEIGAATDPLDPAEHP